MKIIKMSYDEYIEYINTVDDHEDWIERHNGEYDGDYWDY